MRWRVKCQVGGVFTGGGGGLKITEGGGIVHEASATSDHDILHIGERLELGGAGEDWSSLPDGEVLEERVLALCSCSTVRSAPKSQGNAHAIPRN
jgi:hypothetical protein